MQPKFSKHVYVYQLDEKGENVMQNGEPVIVREIGSFVFKRPTIRDEMEIGIERLRLLKGLNPEEVDRVTGMLLEFNVRFPRLVDKAPDGFDWNIYSIEDVIAISRAYAEGLDESTRQS